MPRKSARSPITGRSSIGPVKNGYKCLQLFASLARMNPDYLWLTGAIQLLAFFVVGPALAIVIACATWRGKAENFSPGHYRKLCVASGTAALLLLSFAMWINADVRSALYFLQLGCVVLSGLSFGVCMGYGFSVLLHLWHFHKNTRL